jgi:hypothetical protein
MANTTASPSGVNRYLAGPSRKTTEVKTQFPPTHRETLDDCMGDWDTQTHMSKSEWREACRRTLNGTEMGGLDLLGLENAANGGQKKHSRR